MIYPILFSVLAASAYAADNTLSFITPSQLTVCQPQVLNWSGATGKATLYAIPPGQINGTPFLEIVEIEDSAATQSYVWTVDLSNTVSGSTTLKITDSTGNSQFTSIVNIVSGSSTSCISSANRTIPTITAKPSSQTVLSTSGSGSASPSSTQTSTKSSSQRVVVGGLMAAAAIALL